jgi:hypothetical protein
MDFAAPLSLEATAAYLRTLPSIRERCGRVFELAKQGKLEYFEYHPEKEADVVTFCTQIIQRDFGTNFSSVRLEGTMVSDAYAHDTLSRYLLMGAGGILMQDALG